MKTKTEIFTFYGVEVGKHYLVTKQRKFALANQYVGRSFTPLKSGSIKFDDSSYENQVIILEDLDYEETATPVQPPVPVLTDEEKAYLKAVINPFKEYVESISKNTVEANEYITITLDSCVYTNNIIDLPEFEKNSMYKRMKKFYCYTLEELEL